MPAVIKPFAKSLATELIRKKKYTDRQIARLLNSLDFRISHASVRLMREPLGIQPSYPLGPGSRTAKKTVLRIQELLSKSMRDKEIIGQLKKDGLNVSPVVVRSLRIENAARPGNNINPYSERSIRKYVGERIAEAFGELNEKQRVQKWNALTSLEQSLSKRMFAAKSSKNLEQYIRLLEKISKAQLQREILFPLLPERVKRAERDIFGKFLQKGAAKMDLLIEK